MSTNKPAALKPGGMTVDEIKRTVEAAKRSGLISGGNAPVRIGKAGDEATALGRVESKWVEVTPERAAHWLQNNFRNRPMKEDVVAAYARDMRNGQWVATHQGIAFNERDELIDGQHRLKAVVASGCAVRMMVTFGLPSVIEGREMTTMDAVDRGRTRSVADQLVIQHGFKHGALVAAVCASLANLCCEQRTRRLSVGETLEVFRAFEKPVLFVIEHRSKQPGLRSAGVLAGFAFAIACPADGAQAMFKALNWRTNAASYPVIATLREFLLSPEVKLFTRSLDRGLAELTLQAIWHETQGRRVEKLEMGVDGVNYFRAEQAKRVAKIAGLFKI